MPVTKTAKRALRVSNKKREINYAVSKKMEIAIREAEEKKNQGSLSSAMSAIDRAAKSGVIHKNKAANIKSRLSKLVRPAKSTKKQSS